MVELVGHTLVDGTVTLDVDDVSNLVCLHVRGQLNVSLLAEVAREHVARTRAETERVGHFLLW